MAPVNREFQRLCSSRPGNAANGRGKQKTRLKAAFFGWRAMRRSVN